MNTMRTAVAIAVSAIVLACAAKAAQSLQSPAEARDTVVEAFSADLVPTSKARLPSARFSPAVLPAAGVVAAAAAPTVDEVSDVDSFGRNLTWLGLMQGNVTLTHSGCPTPADPTTACVDLAPAGTPTGFVLDDIARMVLPPKASNSLLCHWFSPLLTLNYQNPTGAPVVGRLNYSPTLTVENEVLNDPSLIDPTTGAAFAGKLRTSMTSSERFEVPLATGMSLNTRERDTATCIAGFLSKRALVDTYGLTDAQARQFFKKKTTLRLNVSGSALFVEEGSLIMGLRVVGD